MARPQRCLCKGIKFEPEVFYFKPSGSKVRELEIIELSLEELESYRLRYLEELDQQEAAKKMKISASTYQRILYAASRKIAEVLTMGKAIKIIRHEQYI